MPGRDKDAIASTLNAPPALERRRGYHNALESEVASKKSSRPRGRPAWDWRDDPDRYAIAVVEAFQSLGLDERKAIDLTVVQFQGREIPPADHQHNIAYELRSEPGSPATISGRASTLRAKLKKTTRWNSTRHEAPAGFVEWRK